MQVLKRLNRFVIVAIIIFSLIPIAARADFSIEIIELNPTSGVIAEEEEIIIVWKVTCSDGSFSSGAYQIEVGGDGNPGTGSFLESGTVNADAQVSTTISSEELGEVDDDYEVYIIVTNNEDDSDQDFYTQYVTLDNPPDPPTNLTVNWGDEKLEIIWDGSKDKDIEYYLLYYGTISRTDSSFEGYYNGSDSPRDVGITESYTLDGLVNWTTYYIALSAVDEDMTEGDYSEEVSGIPQETLGMGDLSDEDTGCFIATAAFGGKDAPAVQVLRSFRDRVLNKSAAGRFFVKLYYRFSPPVANTLKQYPLLNGVARVGLGPLILGAILANQE